MPVVRAATRATPAGKQRVRTGCLRCRKRRRKCDERKPRCQNCEDKGFTCEYRIDLTFVQSSNSASLQPEGGSKSGIQKYSTIRFIVNDAVSASTSIENDRAASEQLAQGHESQNEGSSAPNLAAQPGFNDGPATTGSSSPVETSIAPFGFRSFPVRISPPHSDVRERAPLDRVLSVSAAGTASNPIGNQTITHQGRGAASLSCSNYLAGRPEATEIDYETGLLRHYRYNVAPWIDIGDPECSFGIKVMLGAKEHRSLFEAILALAACHRSLTYSPGSSDLESAIRYRREAENGLTLANEHIRRAGTIILMLGDFFSSCPHEWRGLLFQHLSTSGVLSSLAGLMEHLDEPLFWLYLRIDLATAIAAAQPPLLPFLSYLHKDGSPRNQPRPLSQSKSPKHAFQQVLYLLASCLSLIFGIHEASSPVPEHSRGAVLAPMRNPALPSRWTSLWTDCQGWYNGRPVELLQVVEIRGVEVDRIDTQKMSSFPILIYTTPLALVSNAIYHIASLLLLMHKPRLLKAVAGPRCFMSHIWHAQSIAGIATSNDSPEQWDPILVTGLILVAKDMTHEAQQSAVLERLQTISATTGMKLDQEIESLKSNWSIAGLNEGAIT